VPCGFVLSAIFLVFVFHPYISLERHGVLRVNALPKWLNFVIFENNLVEITVGDIGFSREHDISCMMKCKDLNYGQLFGSSYKGQFLFEYANNLNGYAPKYINDINKNFEGNGMNGATK
jgi:hypothetical protein